MRVTCLYAGLFSLQKFERIRQLGFSASASTFPEIWLLEPRRECSDTGGFPRSSARPCRMHARRNEGGQCSLAGRSSHQPTQSFFLAPGSAAPPNPCVACLSSWHPVHHKQSRRLRRLRARGRLPAPVRGARHGVASTRQRILACQQGRAHARHVCLCPRCEGKEARARPRTRRHHPQSQHVYKSAVDTDSPHGQGAEEGPVRCRFPNPAKRGALRQQGVPTLSHLRPSANQLSIGKRCYLHMFQGQRGRSRDIANRKLRCALQRPQGCEAPSSAPFCSQ